MTSELSKILFLCTGNYYRSRFAEILFNTLAVDACLAWVASSRGIAVDLGIENVGPLSPHAARGLRERNILIPTPTPWPAQVREEEMQAADLIVALKESEHRPLLVNRYPAWIDRVEYWHIDDLDCALPDVALTQIETQTRALISRLSGNGHATILLHETHEEFSQ